MTLLSVVRSVCAVVGVNAPQSVFSNITGNRTAFEMLELATEMAQRIAYDNRDWTALKAAVTFVGGTGAAIDPSNVFTRGCDAFNLPANYKRMLLNSNVWLSTSTQQPMLFIPNADEWMNRRLGNVTHTTWGEWTMLGGQMIIYPAMQAYVPAVPAAPPVAAIPAVPAVTATFAYSDKNCINLASGGRGDAFMSDNDSFVLDERMLRLGMIWQWKAQKGSPYAEDMGTYGDALTQAMGHDSPAPILMDRPARTNGQWRGSWNA